MSKNDILISMARYVHSFYDIEISIDDPKLHAKLKRFISVKPNDELLNEYWSEYLASVTPDIDSVETNEAHDEQPDEQPAVFYRGVKVSGSKTATRTDAKEQQSSQQKKSLMYRGQKLN